MFKSIIENKDISAGITVKDPHALEENNMALHICQDEKSIIANRQELADHLNVDLEQFVCANQTHSDRFHHVTVEDKGKGAFHSEDAIDNVDALYTFEPNIVTFEPNIVLTTFTADCVPVLFYEKASGLIGVIHSGWKGTVQSITEKVLLHLQTEHLIDPTKIKVYLGRCLSPRNFEVDRDVARQFQAFAYGEEYIYYDDKKKKYMIDNQAFVKEQCKRAGVLATNIEQSKSCTMDAQDGFSYREDQQTGRHLTWIMRK